MKTGRLYPRESREDVQKKRDEQLRIAQAFRPWRVDYDLSYDYGGSRWTGYYRTYITARIAAFWNVTFASWGGDAYLYRAGTKGMF